MGPRRVALVGVLVMGCALASLSTATGTRANWIFLWAIAALGTLGVHTTVWTSAVASRFTKSRGFAFAVTLSGASVGVSVFPLLATKLIGAYGWRQGFVAMAAIWMAIVYPLVLIFFRGAKDKARKPAAEVEVPLIALTGVTFAEGMRSPGLYKLLIASGMFAFTLIGVLVHFVPILTDSGAQPMQAAGIASLIGIFSIIGRLSTGVLLDKFPGHLVGACAFLIPIIACTLLLLDGANPLSQSAAAAIVGLTVGSEVDVIAFLAAKHFGLKNFGALYGVLQMALMFGTAFGPLAAGAVYDHYGSYQPFLILTIVLMAVSAIALASMKSAPATFAESTHAP
jgi:MFS family permease